ncbi:MAG: hypothetical protein JRE64_07410 [Deltaproteobacteria bacterium]|nr:hypothetical protein [Deltaproteobacteria bacterium]
MNAEFIGYWHWFLKGSGGKAGFRRILNKWILFHLSIGLVLTLLVKIDLQTAANAVLLPLAGIFVGLSFAWAGNAQALMQTSEINEMANFHEGGFEEYVFVYQTAILTILVTLVFWGIAGLSVFDTQWPTQVHNKCYFGVKTLLFTLSSLTLRECWHVVMGAQWMLLVQRKIRCSKSEKSNGK